MDFRSPEEIADLAREVRGLNQTVLDMHRENLDTARTRREGLEQKLGEMAAAIHTLALAVQSGDSKLAQELAAHIATAHHIGTVEALTAHEVHLTRHDAEIGKLSQRLGSDDGRRAAESEHRDRHILVWGLIVAASVGLVQTVAQLVGSVWQALATLIAGKGS